MLHSPGSTEESAVAPPTGDPILFTDCLLGCEPGIHDPDCQHRPVEEYLCCDQPEGRQHASDCSSRPCTDGVTPEELHSGCDICGALAPGHPIGQECPNLRTPPVDVGDEAIREILANCREIAKDERIENAGGEGIGCLGHLEAIEAQLARLEAYLSGLRAR